MPEIAPIQPAPTPEVLPFGRLIEAGQAPLEGNTVVDDPRWRYRCTFLYANDVAPPKAGGSVADQTVHTDRPGADLELAAARDREDLGRIMIEERMGDPVVRGITERRGEWRTVASWTRRADTGNAWRKG
jgi:hypothetical protein